MAMIEEKLLDLWMNSQRSGVNFSFIMCIRSKFTTSNTFRAQSFMLTVASRYSLLDRVDPVILPRCALKVFTNSIPF